MRRRAVAAIATSLALAACPQGAAVDGGAGGGSAGGGAAGGSSAGDRFHTFDRSFEFASQLALSREHLYFRWSTRLSRKALDGRPAEQVYQPEQGGVTLPTVSDGHLWFAVPNFGVDGGLFALRLDGGTPERVSSESVDSSVTGLRVRDGVAYACVGNGRLDSYPLDGGPKRSRPLFGSVGCDGFEVDATSVYLKEGDLAAGHVLREPRDGGAAVRVGAGLSRFSIQKLLLAEGLLYVSGLVLEDGGTAHLGVQSVPLDGGAASLVFEDSSLIQTAEQGIGLARGALWVLASERLDAGLFQTSPLGRLIRVPLAGGAAQVMRSGLIYPRAMVASDDAVFYSVEEDSDCFGCARTDAGWIGRLSP